MEKQIRDDLRGEIFFMNPREELEYFEKRLAAIEKYDVDFFREEAKNRLIRRYIKALAILSLEDPMEVRAFRDLYVECLTRLGISDYCIEQEVANYITTHGIGSDKDMFVSAAGRKV